ncbi:unnamed protein product [Linum trigynum]|uniref:Uncharacterized protein n=1 Tax=Linum trigynum TaxID=586398 RepID=A0AAV2CU86_9ROSI
MKLEGKQGHKSGTEAFEYINNHLGSLGLKSGENTLKEDQKGLPRDTKLREDYVDQILYKKTSDEVAKIDSRRHDEYSENLDDSSPDNGDVELRRFVVEPLQNTDEMPELMVCYEDNSNHAVKDICIDEGVPLQDKFLFDMSMDEGYLSTFLPPEKAVACVEVLKEPVEVISVPKSSVAGPEDEDLPSIEFKDAKDMGFVNVEFHSERSMQNKEVEEKEASDNSNALKRSLSLGDLLALPEPGENSSNSLDASKMPDENQASAATYEGHENDSMGASSVDPSMISVSKQDKQEGVTTATTPASTKSESPKGSSVQENEEHERHSLDSVSDELADDVVGRLSFEGRARNAAAPVITPQSEKEKLLSSDDSDLVKTLISPRIGGTDSQPNSNRLQYNQGESSFTMVGSEPVPYSGSISMRSDSSATSTRSFAFPVLQNEWNSSPVRMAKADRRHFRKHRPWRQGLLCCKF